MDDLVTWLWAQLDEDERVARAADGPHWRPGDGSVSTGGLYALDGDGANEMAGWAIAWFEIGETNSHQQLPAFSNWRRHPHENSVHAARHDPARVLREVETKRLQIAIILTALTPVPTPLGYPEAARKMKLEVELAEEQFAATMLRLFALPYADRPGYRDEWRP